MKPEDHHDVHKSPIIGRYSEAAQSNPHLHAPFIENLF
jgi:hypothetical protein